MIRLWTSSRAASVPTSPPPDGPTDPAAAGRRLTNWGFLANPDLPDRPGPAHLFVALRPVPTLRHFDPEIVEFWQAVSGRGRRATLNRASPMPVDRSFAWGLIRVVDRLGVSNDYLTFGGRLVADLVDDAVVAVFTSDAPLLRRGGHSQGWDIGASDVGAFFGRLLLAVDFVPGFEAVVAAAPPLACFAAFVADLVSRYRRSEPLRTAHPALWALLAGEERRLRREHPTSWANGVDLLACARKTA